MRYLSESQKCIIRTVESQARTVLRGPRLETNGQNTHNGGNAPNRGTFPPEGVGRIGQGYEPVWPPTRSKTLKIGM